MKVQGFIAPCVMLLVPLSGWAQDGGQRGARRGTDMSAMTSQRPADTAQDGHFLSTMRAHFRHGVDLAKLGQEKASHDGVRQLASQMADDEQTAADRLQALQRLQPAGSGATASDAMTTTSGTSADKGKPDPMVKMQQHLDWLRLLEGPAFDAAFLWILTQHYEDAVRLAKEEARIGARGEVKAFANGTQARATRVVESIQQLQRAAWSDKRR